MELYLVINLTLVVTGLLNDHQCLQLGTLVLLPFIPGSKYLLPADEVKFLSLFYSLFRLLAF